MPVRSFLVAEAQLFRVVSGMSRASFCSKVSTRDIRCNKRLKEALDKSERSYSEGLCSNWIVAPCQGLSTATSMGLEAGSSSPIDTLG